jgi:hypothetical protein
MSIETAVFTGMSIVALWGVAVLLIAAISSKRSRPTGSPGKLSHP